MCLLFGVGNRTGVVSPMWPRSRCRNTLEVKPGGWRTSGPCQWRPLFSASLNLLLEQLEASCPAWERGNVSSKFPGAQLCTKSYDIHWSSHQIHLMLKWKEKNWMMLESDTGGVFWTFPPWKTLEWLFLPAVITMLGYISHAISTFSKGNLLHEWL